MAAADLPTRAAARKPRGALPQLGEYQVRMKAFHGHWEGAGRTSDGGAMSVVEDVRWLEGGFFLESRFDQEAGGRRHSGMSLLGWDGGRGTYVMQMADNLGFARTYAMIGNGRVWRLDGDFERAVFTFSEDGQSLTERWESSADGATFAPLCEFTIKRRR